MKTLLLIDANSIIHRAFHALPPLTSKGGQPIQSVYGISSILLKLWREEKSFDGAQGRPDYAAALFDRPEPTFREKKYAEYKAQRPTAPDELISQIIEAHNLFPAFGIKTFESAGYEADDLIATLAEKFRKEPDLKIVILTGDLDTLQLVEGDKVVVRTFKKGISDTLVYNEKAVEERYGLKPGQLADYKGLVGDPSDNVKGVPGVGPKTAAEILKKYGTLEAAYENLAQGEKTAKKLSLHKKEAELAKHLVTLERQVPVEIGDLDKLEIRDGDEKVREYFAKMGFETLLRRLDFGVGSPAKLSEVKLGGREKSPASIKTTAGKQGRIFSPAQKEKPPPNAKGVIFIEDSFGAERYSKDYVSKKLKVGFGLKPLIKDLWKKDKDLAPPYFDLGVAFWLLNPDFKSFEPGAAFPEFLKRPWRGGREDLTAAHDFCREKLDERELTHVFENIEMPLLRILAEMESFGIGVSRSKLKELEKAVSERLEALTKSVYGAAGEGFNVNSPQKVSEILFDKLKINGRTAPRTKTGLRSTRAENLEELKDAHPIVPLILDYRESFKTLSTYVRPMGELLDAEGRLHTEYIQTGTGTGRLSSQSPNLQNIPQESIWAKDLRSTFVASEEFSFVAFDYSQLELRLLAHLSHDAKMERVFRDGLDIHRITASKILGIPLEKIGASDRRLAKILNFGLIYGMGPNAFAKTSGVSLDEARSFIGNYFREFSAVKGWQEKMKTNTRTFGYVETPTGRRRYLPGLASESPRVVAEAERAALNFPIQGFGADLLKISMIGAQQTLAAEKLWGESVQMLLSIHDELLFQVRDDKIKAVVPLVRRAMEDVYKLDVPLVVNISFGKDWGHLADLK